MLLELLGSREKKSKASSHFPLSMVCVRVLCLEAKHAEAPTLCMGAPGGLYRPTPRGYNGNPTGNGSHPSVSMLAGFSAGWWVPPAGGSRRLLATWSTGRSHRLGSCRRLLTVAAPLMMRALSR